MKQVSFKETKNKWIQHNFNTPDKQKKSMFFLYYNNLGVLINMCIQNWNWTKKKRRCELEQKNLFIEISLYKF